MTEDFDSNPDNLFANCTFKTDRVRLRTQFLHGLAKRVLEEMALWCAERGVTLEVTESVTTWVEDKGVKRLSETHRTARAFDLSVRGWTEELISEFISYFNEKFKYIAAIGATSGKAELILRHDNGHGDHMHVQISKVYAVRDPLKNSGLIA